MMAAVLVRRLVLCSVVSAFQLRTSFLGTRLERRATVELTLDEVPIASEVEPLHNYMLVKVASTVDSTMGGVLLPEKAKEKPTEGVVVATGPGRIHPDTGILMKTAVDVGARVLYGKYDGTPVKYCGEDHQLIRDDDVLLSWQGEETLTIENATPIRDRVLLQVTKAEDVTTTGIALAPGVAQQQKTSIGQVIKLGEGRISSNGDLIPMPVELGQSVKYRDYAGSDIKIGGDDFVCIRIDAALAKWSTA